MTSQAEHCPKGLSGESGGSMGAQAALARLAEERKLFRKNRPLGFQARPSSMDDGSLNLMVRSRLVAVVVVVWWQGTLKFCSCPHSRMSLDRTLVRILPCNYLCKQIQTGNKCHGLERQTGAWRCASCMPFWMHHVACTVPSQHGQQQGYAPVSYCYCASGFLCT